MKPLRQGDGIVRDGIAIVAHRDRDKRAVLEKALLGGPADGTIGVFRTIDGHDNAAGWDLPAHVPSVAPHGFRRNGQRLVAAGTFGYRDPTLSAHS
jgi:hypothetical protein